MDCRAQNALDRGIRNTEELADKKRRYDAAREEFEHESREVYQRAILPAQQKGDKTESSALQREYRQAWR
jgi:hypothetical protein